MSKSGAEQSGNTASNLDRQRLKLPSLRTVAIAALAGLVGYSAGASQNVDEAAFNALRDRQAATSNQLDSALKTLAATQGISKDTLLGKGLRKPDELPGRGKLVTKQQRGKLAASAIAILARPKGEATYYAEASCSGNKVAVDGNSYILTASHCLDATYDRSRVQPYTYAADVLPSDRRKYVIAQSTTDSVQDNRRPIAEVTAASIIVGGRTRPDIALLKVKPVTEGKGVGLYDEIPSIPYKEYASQPPQLGSEAAFYGVPADIKKVAVSGVGTYLGRVQPNYDHRYAMDVFGFNITDARKDPVFFGSSGSSAIGADGHMFGPLSHRYGSEAEKHQPLSSLSEPYELVFRLQRSDELGVDVGQYPVLGTTTVLRPYVFKDLVDGFDYHLAGDH